MDDILNKYKEYLKYELNYSELTIKEYFLHLEEYLEYVKCLNLKYESITKDDVIKYLKYLDNRKLSNKTVSNKLSSLRSFYDFLLDDGKIDVNVFKLVHNPKLEKRLPNFLSYNEIVDIINSIECKSEADFRNKLIIELLYSSGIRVSELVNIKLSDINFTEKSIRIMGKGSKERIVLFNNNTEVSINDYMHIRHFESDYLILNNKGNKITTRSIELIIKKVVSNLALKVNVSPHTFRHSFATHLLNGGADIKSVQELLGHSSLNTTEIYTHITSDYLKSEYLDKMPRK